MSKSYIIINLILSPLLCIATLAYFVETVREMLPEMVEILRGTEL